MGVTRTILAEQIVRAENISELRALASDALTSTDGKTQADDINFTVVDFRILRGSITGMEQDIQQLFNRGIDEYLQMQWLKEDLVKILED